MIHMYFIKNSCSDEKVYKYISTYFHKRGIYSQGMITVISVEVLNPQVKDLQEESFKFFPDLFGLVFEIFCLDNWV